MNKRRRYKAKRRHRATRIAWQHCHIMTAMLRAEGCHGVVVRPLPKGVMAVLDREGHR